MAQAQQIILGVTGGIAAYKAAALTSELVQAGLEVRVVMTEAAHQFIGAATFTALTDEATITDLYDARYPLGAHIELARSSDLLCIAPATANFMAKAAHGIGDEILSTLYLCFTGPVLLAPAMNCEMWDKPAVQRNVSQLQNDGVQFVGPESGWLSCRAQGMGRMSDPQTIAAAIRQALPDG